MTRYSPASVDFRRGRHRFFSSLLSSVLLVLLGLVGCAPQQEVAEQAPEEPAFLYAEKILASLEPKVPVVGQELWTLEERMAHHRTPALSLAVWHDYEIVWAAAFGMADVEAGKKASTETLFQAGSISKPVAAAAVLAAWQLGELDLDAPINSILSSWQLPENELTEKAEVTPRRLLSHSAGTTVHGFPGYAVDEPLPSVLQILDGEGPANTAAIRVDLEPGTQFRYSGGGTTIMQLAMTDLTDTEYPELLRQAVLSPLGMSLSTYENPLPAARLESAAAGYYRDGRQIFGKRHTYPEMAAAGLWTTPSDLARFAIDLQRALRGDDGTLLKRETVEEMITPVLGDSGLGLFQMESNGALHFGHGGADAGFRAFLFGSHEGGYGAALMANADLGSNVVDELVPAIARALGWPGFAPEPIVPASLATDQDPPSLDAYTGLYQVQEHVILAVTRDGDDLMARVLLDQEATLLLPRADGTFISQDDASPLRFELDDAGEVIGYINERRTDDGVRPKLAKSVEPVVLLFDAGRTEEALARLEPDGPSEASLNQLGYTLWRYQRTGQAEKVFRFVVEHHPLSANAYDSLGDILGWLGDFSPAAEAYRSVLAHLEADSVLPPEQKLDYEKRARANIEKFENRLLKAD